MKIALHGADFFAHHGFYPEEQKLGSYFSVDIEVLANSPKNFGEDELSNTINYEQLHRIAAEQMKVPHKLIETLASAILEQIKMTYPALLSIEVTIKKLNPPLGRKVAYSSVTLNYSK